MSPEKLKTVCLTTFWCVAVLAMASCNVATTYLTQDEETARLLSKTAELAIENAKLASSIACKDKFP